MEVFSLLSAEFSDAVVNALEELVISKARY
jgi:hypothetical protein